MNMREWMMLNPRPDRPMFDVSALQGMHGDPTAIQGFLSQWRNQLGDWRNQMRDWRGDRRDYMRGMHGNNPVQGLPTGEVPQPLPPQQPPAGSSYGVNLGQVLQGNYGGGGYAIQNFADRQRFPQRY